MNKDIAIHIYNRNNEHLVSLQGVMGLKIDTVSPGGLSIMEFSVPADVRKSWPEFSYGNHVEAVLGDEIIFDGVMDAPRRSINPDTIAVSCQSYGYQLNDLGVTSNVSVGAEGYKMSTFITNVLLADDLIELSAGDIDTSDYEYPNGTVFEFQPYTTYASALETLNEGNNWDYGVEPGKRFYFRQPKTDIDWYVHVDDCSSLTIAPNPENLANYIIVSYSPSGSYQLMVTAQDPASQSKYGVKKKLITVQGKIATGSSTPPYTGAYAIAHTALEDMKELKVSAELTCRRIYNTEGIEEHLVRVRAGDVIRLLDWLPSEERMNAVTDIATFRVKSTSYNHDDYTLEISPTEFLPRVEIALARLAARGY